MDDSFTVNRKRDFGILPDAYWGVEDGYYMVMSYGRILLTKK